MKKERRLYLQTFIGLLIVVALAVLLLGRPEATPSDILQASSYNPAPAGNLALYRTLNRLGWPVARWQEDYPRLGGSGEVMVVARGPLGRQSSFSQAEITRLLNWVRQGNRLILLGDFTESEDTRPLLEKLGLNVPQMSVPTIAIFDHTGQFFGAGRDTLTATGPEGEAVLATCYPLPALPKEATVLLEKKKVPYAAILPTGRGSVALVASASLIDNEFLGQAGNLALTLRLLQPDGHPPARVWFEETHHGYRSSYAISGLMREPGLTLALAQMALGLIVFVLSQFHRFGQVLPLHHEESRSALDFIRSMALLYRRADQRNAIVRGLYEETRALIIQRLNLPPDVGNDLIARRLRQLHPHLPDWKKLAERYDSDKFVQGLPPGGWLILAQDLARIKKEMM